MREMELSILQYAPLEDEQVELSLLGQLAIAHVQFETIHPYLDGNGRVGRLLLPLLLAAAGYPPLYVSGALLRARREYYEALAAVQLRGDWSPWLTLLGKSVIESCNESITIASDLLALAERWESQLSTRRAKSAARRLPRFLIGHPVLSVNQAAAGLGLSVQAANTACNGLLDAGILRLLDERRRNRIFIAPEVLERLDRPPA
jgi:Fic family protein